MNSLKNSLRIDKQALELARKQFCLDIGMPWEEYLANLRQQVYLCKAVYKEGTRQIDSEGARVYEGRNDFFHAMICLGQLFLVVDEQIYDWAVEKFSDYPPEWFCEYGNLRVIDEKLKEFGHQIKDTHVYMLPEAVGESDNEAADVSSRQKPNSAGEVQQDTVQDGKNYIWYDQEEILKFKENNKFGSAICFSQTQPDMLAVAAVKSEAEMQETVSGILAAENGSVHNILSPGKTFDQSLMSGMAGVSADGEYLWQIGINVIPEAEGKGLAGKLVRMMKDEVLRQGKTPFYGTSESHTVSQTVGLKAGFVPAWTEVYVKQV